MKTKNIIWIVLAVLILMIGAAAFFMRIENVTITGNNVNSAEDLEQRIFDCEKFSRHTVYQVIKQMLGNKEEIPFVEDYKIVFNSYKDVEVIVYEKSIVGYVTYMGNYMYFDKDGIIVDSSSEMIEGIPEVTGLDFGSIVLYRSLPIEDQKIFDDVLTITQSLQNHHISCKRIEFHGLRESTLYLGDVTVVLGKDESLDAKVDELSNILPNLRERMSSEGIGSGTLYLDSFDENTPPSSYTFKKN